MFVVILIYIEGHYFTSFFNYSVLPSLKLIKSIIISIMFYFWNTETVH